MTSESGPVSMQLLEVRQEVRTIRQRVGMGAHLLRNALLEVGISEARCNRWSSFMVHGAIHCRVVDEQSSTNSEYLVTAP